MATARKNTDAPPEPITVKIAPAEPVTPEGIDLDTPSFDDFDKPTKSPIPPRKAATKTVGKRPSVENELQRLREELERNVSFMGLLACAKDPWGGQLILLNKDSLIDKWIDVCRINPTIRKALLSAMDMGVYATAITSTLAVVIAFLAHAGLLPNGELLLTAVGGAGVTVPTDDQVAMTEALFGAFSPNGDSDTN